MNNVVLSGRVAKDLVCERVGERDKVTLTLAVRREFKNKDGGYDADFVRCICWGNNASYLKSYAGKGTMLELTGQIRTGSFEKNGVKQFTTDILVDKVSVLAPANKNETAVKPVKPQTVVDTTNVDIDDDDLPF